MDLINELRLKMMDYKSVLAGSRIHIGHDPDQHNPHIGNHIISVIIPVRGRERYHKPVIKYFTDAKYHSYQDPDNLFGENYSIKFTIVEHSFQATHEAIARENDRIKYVWIPAGGKPFNKCLCHNIGAIVNSEADFYLFHDIDTIVPQDFFIKLWENWKRARYRGAGALQSFTKRRLLHCNKSLSEFILDDIATVSSFSLANKDLSAAKHGAQGGSIFIPQEYFIAVGGYDDCFFSEYSVEDAAFYDKVQLITNMDFCDDPAIELLHLEHPANRVTKPVDVHYWEKIKALSIEDKKQLIAIQRDHLANYFPKQQSILIPQYVQGVIDTMNALVKSGGIFSFGFNQDNLLSRGNYLINNRKFPGTIVFNKENGVFCHQLIN